MEHLLGHPKRSNEVTPDKATSFLFCNVNRTEASTNGAKFQFDSFGEASPPAPLQRRGEKDPNHSKIKITKSKIFPVFQMCHSMRWFLGGVDFLKNNENFIEKRKLCGGVHEWRET
jgi:hypothetical protein